MIPAALIAATIAAIVLLLAIGDLLLWLIWRELYMLRTNRDLFARILIGPKGRAERQETL